MRKILCGLLLFSSSAHASWLQEYCSNAEGTVKLASGHDKNYVELTSKTYGVYGMITVKPVIIENARFDVVS
ncbi:MAG: hypothetical protein EOP04_22260, partial [Proteobacteria bacterium]